MRASRLTFAHFYSNGLYMSLIENLCAHLETVNPYPCLSILESAIVCYQRFGHARIPNETLVDAYDMYGLEQIKDEINTLYGLGLAEKNGSSLHFKNEILPPMINIVFSFRKSLGQNFQASEANNQSLLRKLTSYLHNMISDLSVESEIDEVETEVLWNGCIHRLYIAISPVWLPIVADEIAQNNSYLALFGPFAAQNWQQMMRYYAYQDFRNHTAYFDPWNRQKMNISKTGLFTYFDWFFRDIYGMKLIIPYEFSRSLQGLGLLRINDEE